MRYPYIVHCPRLTVHPLFKNLSTPPMVLEMGKGHPMFEEVKDLDTREFQLWLDQAMADAGTDWALASYLENREPVLSKYPQMRAEQRWYHLGLDIAVPLDTPLYAPLDGRVVESNYEPGDGNYGGHVLLAHEGPDFETFYSLYGHLNRQSLPQAGTAFKAGECFARIGDFLDNGNWFHHTHLQVITQKGLDQGWLSKGYCAASDLGEMEQLCPSPLALFTV